MLLLSDIGGSYLVRMWKNIYNWPRNVLFERGLYTPETWHKRYSIETLWGSMHWWCFYRTTFIANYRRRSSEKCEYSRRSTTRHSSKRFLAEGGEGILWCMSDRNWTRLFYTFSIYTILWLWERRWTLYKPFSRKDCNEERHIVVSSNKLAKDETSFHDNRQYCACEGVEV